MLDSTTPRIVPEPAKERDIVVGNVFRALFRRLRVCPRIPAFFWPLSHPYVGVSRLCKDTASKINSPTARRV